MKNIFRAVGWIIVGMTIIALIFFLPVVFFSAAAQLEGLMSIVLLVAGVIVFRVFSKEPPVKNGPALFILIVLFALLGVTLDQTGNFLYNKAIEMVCCPKGSRLVRITEISNPLRGRVDYVQLFRCFEKGVMVKQINQPAWLSIHFVTYLVLGFLLTALRRLVQKCKTA